MLLRELLEDLDPPIGGVAKLRARIRAEKARRRRRHLRLAALPVFAAAVLLLFLLPRGEAELTFDHPSLSSAWPELQVSVDGHTYEPMIRDGVVWVSP